MSKNTTIRALQPLRHTLGLAWVTRSLASGVIAKTRSKRFQRLCIGSPAFSQVKLSKLRPDPAVCTFCLGGGARQYMPLNARSLSSSTGSTTAKPNNGSPDSAEAHIAPKEKEADRTVFCSGLSFKVDEKSLHGLFEPHGKIVSVFVPREKTKTESGFEMLGKGYALVTFSMMAEAEHAVSVLDGKTHMGRKLKIHFKKGSKGALRMEQRKKQVKEERARKQSPDEAEAEERTVRVDSGERSEAKKVVAASPQPRKSGRQEKQRKSAHRKRIELQDGMSIKALAESMGVRLVDCIKSVIRLGEQPKTIEHELELSTSELVVLEHDLDPVMPAGAVSHKLGRQFTDDEYAALPGRAPIVTIMGHVDHGKTTLLDHLRKSSVAAGEAGGITQSIAAFEVERPGLGRITFVDTPGHMAFTAMRERGAKATDIVVLVVDAFDGVMPQTLEVIKHTQAAKVPVVVAVNKCDLPGADPRRALDALAEEGVVAEELGGDVQAVAISALKGNGIDKLEESIQLLAEMMELRAPADGPGEAAVVEVKKDKALGPLASVIVQVGEIKIGDVVVAGRQWGKVKALRAAGAAGAERVGPSAVAELVGFKEPPHPGEEVYVVPSEKVATEVVERRARQAEMEGNWGDVTSTGAPLQQGDVEGVKEFAVVVKGDVDGAVEAVVAALMQLRNREVAVRVVGTGVGPVTESDVQLAAAYHAVIYAFNLRPPSSAVRKTLKAAAVEVVEHKVIYHLLDHVTERLLDLLPPVEEVDDLGTAQVLQVFKMKVKGGQEVVAGSRVLSGMCSSDALIRVERSGEELFEGKIASLKRNKDTVPEVTEGDECGIVVEGFTEFEAGDRLFCLRRKMVKRTEL